MLPITKNVHGFDDYIWFIAVVESRQDPLFIGRVQVRVISVHSASLNDIPSGELPWASVLQTTAELLVPQEADSVYGFFADGRNCQVPIIVGRIPGLPVIPPNPGQGFSDQRTASQLQLSPKKPVTRQYNTNGSGITVKELNTATSANQNFLRHPNPDELKQPSYSGVTRNADLANTVIAARKNNLDTGVTTATGITWSEPIPAFNPLYPYNRASESESGHVVEVDDTVGNERIAMTHRTGTFWEMYPTGTLVEKITKSKYEIIMADDHVHIMGKAMVTIDGATYVKVLGDVNLECDNDVSLSIAGDLDASVGGDINFQAQGDINFNASGTATILSGGDTLITPGGAVQVSAGSGVNLQGGTINLNGSTSITGLVQAEVAAAVVAHSLGTPVPVIAPGASSGSPVNLPSPPSRASFNNAQVAPERSPVPLIVNFSELDAFQAVAYKQQLFLSQNPDGTFSQPNIVTPSIASLPCNFTTTGKTFLSAPWSLSSSGLSFLQQNEGFAKVIGPDLCQVYPDPVTGGQPYTIGWGTTGPAVGQIFTADTTATKEQCRIWLNQTTSGILQQMSQIISVDLTQNMVDALVDLIYNIGIGNFSGSTLLNDINAQNWCPAGYDFGMWVFANGRQVQGLINRRTAERSRFLS